MNAIARPFSAFGAAVNGTIARIAGGTMRFAARASWGFSFLLGRTQINYRSAVGDPTKNSIVVSTVGWISRNFPEAPVRIRRLGEGGAAEVITPGPTGPGFMLRLLERPNPYFSGVLLWMATIVDLFTTGDAYWIKIRNAADRVTELWWVPRRSMRAAWPEDGTVFISHYLYKIDGVEYRVETRDVVHLRDGIDPDNPRYGQSKLASLFREIYTDDEAANFTAVLLTNLGVPGVVLAPSNTGGPGVRTDPEGTKSKFMETFGGDRRGEPLVLTSPTDVKVLSFNPQQMELKELRRIPEERITAVFGVSAIVAGLGAGLDRSTFTNFGEARKAAYQESIIPLQRLVAAELEVQLLDDFADIANDSLDVDFDTSKASALQEALDAVWKRAESAASKGLITRAAFKQATSQPVAPEDEVYILPNNFMILDSAAATGGTGANPPPPGATLPAPTPITRKRQQQPAAEASENGNGNGHGHDEQAETLWAILARREDASARRDEAFATALERHGSALTEAVAEARSAATHADGQTELLERLAEVASRPINVEGPRFEPGAIAVNVEAPAAPRAAPPRLTRKVVKRDANNQISEVIEEPV